MRRLALQAAGNGVAELLGEPIAWLGKALLPTTAQGRGDVGGRKERAIG